MKSLYKLDALQNLAFGYVGESYALYLIGLLADHAEEEEMTDEFLEWMKKKLNGQNT